MTVFVIILMAINENKELKIKKIWIPIIASLLGGASVGLPLFLYMKQCHIDNELKLKR
ncbi:MULTISPECIES: DUF2834 domain-containing protein [unclassified Acinetobacter]|uniref:DUF2834 domain-containing protein n=1 Tax=unclassified Acinetobacter TaxID=196816 RepID=UPI0029346D09|nr:MULTISPECIES: DUF2834 domain-containing protein [unclassified Acinetobacter]WOE32283.1 DUF2834 domain-containing protein [Acinetobacter sp. SAAs470]WOE37754.1 DUF2834 domain-containing protein [Acinetobacter sp. SAAs474]